MEMLVNSSDKIMELVLTYSPELVGAWVKSADYWGVHFDMNEKVYKTFGDEGLNIPYPQMDVHIDKDS
jgi:small-conductance mechanosensitive channel